MMMQIILVAALALDLNSVRDEQNLERRSELALENANAAIDRAKQAYDAGQMEAMRAALTEVADSVDVAYDALVATGKNARHDKGFKKAEQRTRMLLRRLDGLLQVVGFEDRTPIEAARDRVAEVNEKLLNGIMKKR